MTTQLLLAIRNRASLEEIQELINAQQDINELDFYGQTPLMVATCLNNKAIPLLMTHPKLDVNKTNASGKTALFDAALLGLDLSLFLERSEIDVNAQDGHGNTPLYSTILFNRRSTINQLLADPRTDLSLKNNYGRTVVEHTKRVEPKILPLFKLEIMTLMSPKVVTRLGGTSVTRLPTEIMLL